MDLNSGVAKMLVLERKLNEQIILGSKGDVQIIVVGVRGEKVRIGVRAPRELAIHRKEVFDVLVSGDRPASLSWKFVQSEGCWKAESFYGDENTRENWVIEVHNSGLFTYTPTDMQMAVVLDGSDFGCDSFAEARRKCEQAEYDLERYFAEQGVDVQSLVRIRDARNEDSEDMEVVS